MSRTYRKPQDEYLNKLLQRGHVSIPKNEDYDIDTWEQDNKKERKTRKQRRNNKQYQG